MADINTNKNDFNFGFLEEGFLGYDSANDKTTLAAGYMIRGSKNVYKKKSGTIASRPGIKRRGEADSTDAGITASFEWETSVGTSRNIRVREDNVMEVESDLAEAGTFIWYELLETGTLDDPASELTRFVFDPWWNDTEKADELIMVRGDNKILHWSGGMAVVASVQAISGCVVSVTINQKGSGYTVGDVLTLAGGGVNAQLTVTLISAGQVTGVTVSTFGNGYSTANGVSVTGGTGSGATFNIQAATTYSITKQGSDTWAEVGFTVQTSAQKKFMVNGAEFSYFSGEDTTTIAGIEQDASVFVAGDVAIQSIFTKTGGVGDMFPVDYSADFVKVVGNQAWVGSYSSRVVHISSDADFSDFVNEGDLIAGDPDDLILDSLVKGIGVTRGKVAIFSGHDDFYLITPNSPLPVSSPIGTDNKFVEQKVEKKKLAGRSAALAHEFIGNFADDLIWLDQNNQLRSLGTFSTVDEIKPAHLSLQVQEEISQDDFTGGHLRVIDEIVYITAPNTGRDWNYEIREIVNSNGLVVSERLWQPPQIRSISRFALIDGEVFGHSNSHPQIYQIWETGQWFDDSPTDEPIPYTAVARFAYRQMVRRIHGHVYTTRYVVQTFDKIFIEGYMPQAVNLNLRVYGEYQGSKSLQERPVNGPDDLARFFVADAYPSLGESPEGDNPFGDGILNEADDQELMPKFRTIRSFTPVNCFEYSLEFYSTDADSRWEILAFGPNTEEASQQPTFLRKKD